MAPSSGAHTWVVERLPACGPAAQRPAIRHPHVGQVLQVGNDFDSSELSLVIAIVCRRLLQ